MGHSYKRFCGTGTGNSSSTNFYRQHQKVEGRYCFQFVSSHLDRGGGGLQWEGGTPFLSDRRVRRRTFLFVDIFTMTMGKRTGPGTGYVRLPYSVPWKGAKMA